MNTTARSLPSQPTPGAWLTRQMERRDISVRQIADALEVTTQTVYGWQNDKAAVNESRVPRLAEVLGVSEIEARRGLGYWVPDGSRPEQTELHSELLDLRQQLVHILDRIDEIQGRQ